LALLGSKPGSYSHKLEEFTGSIIVARLYITWVSEITCHFPQSN